MGGKDGPVIVMKLGEVLLRNRKGGTVRVTPRGVLAASGGMDRRVLVVQTVRAGQSDLEFYDRRTHRLQLAPHGVNTSEWEWRGSISGRWLLFGRLDFRSGAYKIVLHDLRTGKERNLDTVRGHAAYAEPGEVNGQFATWAGCPDNSCTIYRYDIRTRRLLRIVRGHQYVLGAPSVARNGDVYYGRGRGPCGSAAQLMRYRPGSGSMVALNVAPGYDFRFTYTVAGGRKTQVLFDRANCRHGGFDIHVAIPH